MAIDGLRDLLRDIDATGQITLSTTQWKRVDDLLLESDSLRVFLRREPVGASGAGPLPVEGITKAYCSTAWTINGRR